jgi:hypothetical protein
VLVNPLLKDWVAMGKRGAQNLERFVFAGGRFASLKTFANGLRRR